MKKAVLNYVIKNEFGEDKVLSLETSSLYRMDLYTSQFNNDIDLINACPKKEKIRDFIRTNGNIKGSIVVSYVTDVYTKKDIRPLYGYSKEILMNDNYDNGDVSEIEKARKLLFNSHGQIFAKLLLANKEIPECYNYRFSLSFQEYLAAKKNDVKVDKREDGYFIDFKELLQYRATHRRLGALRNVYEDMLDVWKRKLDSLNDEDYYYYCRQLRIIMNTYEKLKNRSFSISNLNVRGNVCKSLYGRSVVTRDFKRYRVCDIIDLKKKKYMDVS